jgi:hypothetical protein
VSDPAEPPVLPKPSPAWQGWLSALVVGAIGWGLACQLSGRKEAWDSPYYFQLAYPLFALASVALGYFWPGRPWRWALGIALGQALVAFAKNPTASLMPLGVIVFAIYSAPLILTAMLGNRLHRWRRRY